MTGRLILASNSSNPGGEYLGHLEEAIRHHFSDSTTVAFVPYALADLDGYSATAEGRFESLGVSLESVHRHPEPARVLAAADGVFVGGGNTFRLLDRLIRLGLVEPIRDLVAGGAPYMGTSAGSNVACPTIGTTNDMPIVQPPSFDGLGLVPFQINPHYVERDPDTPHGGETRRQRLAEFHEENDIAVVGLREGSWLDVGASTVLRGPHPAVLFRRGFESMAIEPGEIPDHLLRKNAPPSGML
ncbi:MAG TPA: dipeptidase PepE [Acidimicrobiia bacterium]|nr:dipeptidase PepE [Acidimicrobiia bacterium]